MINHPVINRNLKSNTLTWKSPKNYVYMINFIIVLIAKVN